MSNFHNDNDSNFAFHGRYENRHFSREMPEHKPFPYNNLQWDIDEEMIDEEHDDNTVSRQIQIEGRNTRKSFSAPLMFTPPQINAMQISRIQVNQINTESDPEQQEELKEQLLQKETAENIISQKKAANMLTPFSPMLSWSPTVPSNINGLLENYNTYKITEYNDMIPNLHSLTDSIPLDANKSTELFESITQSQEKAKMTKSVHSLIEDFSFMLEESGSELENEDIESVSENDNINMKIDHTELNNIEVDFLDVAESSSYHNTPLPIHKENEEDSTLEEQFLSMLTEFSSEEDDSALLLNSSIPLDPDELIEESTNLSSLDEDYSDLLERTYALLEESYDDVEKAFVGSYPVDKLDEQIFSSPESSSYILEESQETIEVGEILKNSQKKLNEFSSLLVYISSILESSNEGITSSEKYFLESEESRELQDELSSNEYYLEKQKESLSEHYNLLSDTIEAESDSIYKKSSELQDEFVKDLLNEDSNEDDLCGLPQIHECLPKKYMTIVKLPVLVGKLKINIDIFDDFPLDFPVKNISQLVWSVSSLDSHVILPSSIVFLKGTLIAQIDYANQGPEGTIHTLKVPIPWEKTININWLHPPNMPVSRNIKEYMFKTDHNNTLNSHFEYSQFYSEKVTVQLRSINFVWHNELTKDDNPELRVQGRAMLELDLLQEQYVEI